VRRLDDPAFAIASKEQQTSNQGTLFSRFFLLYATSHTHLFHRKLVLQAVNNIAWLSVPLGLVLSVVVGYGFLYTSSAEEMAIPGYQTTIWLIGTIYQQM